MIWFLLGLHLAVCGALALVGDRLGRRVFVVAALPPAVTTLWAIGRLGAADPVTAELAWVRGLDLSFTFAVGPLATLMTVIVSGIGVAVFVYSIGYFSPGAPGLGRFATTLLAFSTAMVGLVWSDSVWTLFVFWELTSVTSFLLVGFKNTDATARLAARRALLITVSGGLALLAGFVLVTDATGTTRLSEMPPIDGTTATVAAVLVLLAAATKSAQFPFHVWLPGAMAAPTPVSAYLHSATMVKAGVFLVAVASPVFADVAVWKPLGLTLGLVSMIWGAIGALRHIDAKLILAWGTVSQLGLMVALLSLGSAKATFAAVSIVAAHAVFKAALFMIVGEVDVRTRTRDIRKLSGLWRSMPVAFAVAVVSGASMAGVPPLLGFPAKEAAIEAVLGLSGAEAWVAGGAIVGGSVLTVAYTLRFLLGVFATDGPVTAVAPRRPAMTAPSVLLGIGSVAGFVALGAVTDVVRDAAVRVNPDAEVYSLLRWPGLTDAFVISAAIVAVGAVVGVLLARRSGAVPSPFGAEVVDRITDEVVVTARRITGRIQHGSLPVYVATMAATAAIAAVPFVFAIDPDALTLWDGWVQAVLAVLVVAAAGAAAIVVESRLGRRARTRRGGHRRGRPLRGPGRPRSGPDPAAGGDRRRRRVRDRPGPPGPAVPGDRPGVAGRPGGGLATPRDRRRAGSGGGRLQPDRCTTARGPGRPGGGRGRRQQHRQRHPHRHQGAGHAGRDRRARRRCHRHPRARLPRPTPELRRRQPGGRRGAIVSTFRSEAAQRGIQAASPLAVLVAAYLFFAGHNQPGGGFAAGLVLGAVVSLRTVSGLQRPANGIRLLAAGGVVAGLVAVAPLLWGDVVLDQVVLEATLPVLGKVKAGTALVFDAGVALIVVGLVVAVLDGLGASELAGPAPSPSPSGEG